MVFALLRAAIPPLSFIFVEMFSEISLSFLNSLAIISLVSRLEVAVLSVQASSLEMVSPCVTKSNGIHHQ